MTVSKYAGQNIAASQKLASQSVKKAPGSNKDSQRREIMKSMRMDAYTSDVIERAAAITGDSFTHFVIQAALAKAQSALINEAFFPISEEAYHQLADMLENPPELSERMKAEIQERRLVRATHTKTGRAT